MLITPNFSTAEMACHCCHKSDMDEEFMRVLQSIRDEIQRPLKVTSGYRCDKHPIEAGKIKPGSHNTGSACDVQCTGRDAYDLLKLFCADDRVKGIGVNQSGRHHKRYLHVDVITNSPRPNLWSYT